MSKTKIEWADHTLNIIAGCNKVSDGCDNCYALRQSYRCAAMGISKYIAVTYKDAITKRINWTGQLNFDYNVLEEPGKRKTPTRYFVNSMSDTFHMKVPYELIDKIFQMCLNNPCHEFMILTKRPENIISYLETQISRIELVSSIKNLILMTTIENQKVARQRMVSLIMLKGCINGLPVGLSCEPLLGPIEFSELGLAKDSLRYINWVIIGGESGHRARPMYPKWVRDIRDQCVNRGVPFFFKQWGEWVALKQMTSEAFQAWEAKYAGTISDPDGTPLKIGKKKAGRILDGRTWDELPDLSRDR